MSYLGKSVVLTDGTASLSNGTANWTYGLDSAASTTTLTVANSSGKTVYSASGETTAGTHDLLGTAPTTTATSSPTAPTSSPLPPPPKTARR
jgi:flagellar basal-body rod modification protein FlgD